MTPTPIIPIALPRCLPALFAIRVYLRFALRFSPREFGIFDAFPDDAARKAHLSGQIAAALMAKASELLAEPPRIEQVDVLAAKVTA